MRIHLSPKFKKSYFGLGHLEVRKSVFRRVIQVEQLANSFKWHLSVFLILTPILFDGCLSECSDANCPVKCANISFRLFRNGINIFIEDPERYDINSVRLEMVDDPDAPPLLKINKDNAFNFIVCDGVDYKLHLNDAEIIDIRAELGIVTSNGCCDVFGARSVWFNGIELCSSTDTCQKGLSFELP